MITATQIRNGEGYLVKHLAANDYYSEGESVTGIWLGKGASMLGLGGEVLASQYEALRSNKHPSTGQKLTPRSPKVAFHDLVISAPKAFSIAAMVGQDERLVAAFHESARITFNRLEQYAAVRLRGGESVKTEAFTTTGIACAAMYVHDTSRMLDPQVHAHVLFGNLSYSDGRWLALQPRPMLEASKSHIRREFRLDLAKRTRALGYQVECDGEKFRIRGISPRLEKKFSRRTIQREAFEARYLALFGSAPSKARIEAFIKEGKGAATKRFKDEFFRSFGLRPNETEVREFVRDYRSDKMAHSSRAAVLRGQLDRLSADETAELTTLVSNARRVCSGLNQGDGLVDRADGYGEGVCPGPSEEAGQEAQEKSVKRAQERLGKPAAKMPIPSARATGKSKSESADQKIRRIRRLDALRRMRGGIDLAKSINGQPSRTIARQIRNQARRA